MSGALKESDESVTTFTITCGQEPPEPDFESYRPIEEDLGEDKDFFVAAALPVLKRDSDDTTALEISPSRSVSIAHTVSKVDDQYKDVIRMDIITAAKELARYLFQHREKQASFLVELIQRPISGVILDNQVNVKDMVVLRLVSPIQKPIHLPRDFLSNNLGTCPTCGRPSERLYDSAKSPIAFVATPDIDQAQEDQSEQACEVPTDANSEEDWIRPEVDINGTEDSINWDWDSD
ncbi:hypothetical protein UCRPC4_g03622 [Phaeomoniella chlamydospora]|uniref:Uncharacterized protein n=1 Tax=Phaeomoniella chlamydospora TaxID=158046 RepID=A0A0G2GCY9_PHACM|nr:hypothetical protein UCRPC4_g03622 [Phaeomoniella chlamydospora]